LHNAIRNKGQDGRYEQYNAHGSAHSEILLTDHLFVDVHRQDIKLAADHFRRTKVGKRKGKGHENGAQQAKLDAGKGDLKKILAFSRRRCDRNSGKF
jgi:hypothetical protein